MSELAFPMSRECPFDPPAALGRIREAGITRVRLWDRSTPWLVTRYADVRAVLADRRFSSDPTRPGFPASRATSRAARSFIRMDGDEHARQRKALISDFTVCRVESLRPLVVETVDQLLSAMELPADLVDAYALPLPSLVICHLLGVPYADHEFFQRASREMLSGSGDARRELIGYLADLVERRRRKPADDLVSRLVANDELSRRDVVSMSALLLIAGHETTANMIALGTLTLLQNPSQADDLRAGADPSAAVEELLRLLTIVHLGRRRVATSDVRVGDVLIRAGEGVIAAADAANRDPSVFDNADALDIHRKPNHHLAFGFGVHQCLGQPLARLELQIAYPALLRRFPTLRLAVPVEDLTFRSTLPVYGVDALPVAP